MSSNTAYILNPTSGRYIVKGGTLHRRLIRQGKMPAVELSSRVPTRTTRTKGKTLDKYIPASIYQQEAETMVPKPIKLKKPKKKTNDEFLNDMKSRLADKQFQQQFVSALKTLKA